MPLGTIVVRAAADNEVAASDALLIARVRAGDPVAARTFYDCHVDAVYRRAARLTRDPELARDCTQDVFIRAFDRLSQFRGDGPVAAWLQKITQSVVLNTLIRVTALQTTQVPLDEVEIAMDPVEVEPSDRLESLACALAALPVAQRGPLLAFYKEGYTHQELATALGISVGASRVRLARARAQLRRLMTGSGCPTTDGSRH